MMKHKKLVLCVCMVAVVALCSVLFFVGRTRTAEGNTQIANETKAPDAYTWEEYQAMSPEEQDAFFHRFASVEAFEAWKESVKPEEYSTVDMHWDKKGKQPDAYTWEEYQALSLEEQEAFYQWFSSEVAFEAWMESAKPNEEAPVISEWSIEGKLPNEYTWEEYLALKPEEKEAFFLWFETEANFELWKNSVKPDEPTVPILQWNKPGKLPSEYTWEEYQALKPEEQEAFYGWFGSVSAFEMWMDRAKPQETVPPVMGWNKPGKKPNEYTWEEYQALSPEEKDAFYSWFDSMEAFESWMNSVKENEDISANTNWNKSGKKPDEYTLAEYQALSPEDQERFYNWFESAAAFETWLESARSAADASAGSVWNKPGKTPDQYTKEEYLALSAEEKEAFFQWFDSLEAFEAWVEKVENQ